MIKIGIDTPVTLASGVFRVTSTLPLDWFVNKNPQRYWVPETGEEFTCMALAEGPAIWIEGSSWYGMGEPCLTVSPETQFVTREGKPVSAANVYVGARLYGRFGDFIVKRKRKVRAFLYEVNVTSAGWLDIAGGGR